MDNKELREKIEQAFKDSGAIYDYKTDVILDLIKQQKTQIIEKINPFDLVEPCNPDCTLVEHAYHQGTWDSQLKLAKILEDLKTQL